MLFAGPTFRRDSAHGARGSLIKTEQKELVNRLMKARRAVRDAKKAADLNAEGHRAPGRRRGGSKRSVSAARCGQTTVRDYNRHMAEEHDLC